MAARFVCSLLVATVLAVGCSSEAPGPQGAERGTPTAVVPAPGGMPPAPLPAEASPVPVEPVLPATTVPVPASTPPGAAAGASPAAIVVPVTPTRTPPVRFDTLPPGAQLPSAEECSHWVRRSDFEPRPENARANHVTPPPVTVHIDGSSDGFNAKWAARIDGRFTGTTDEIIQWASCKWGFDEDMTRARAVAESTWRQSVEGDRTSSATTCRLIGKTAPCAQSYGLLQVKGTVHEGTYPWAATSTAFNADYSLAWLRACYEGDFTWLKGSYRAGDLNGCVGAWFSGNWKDQGANSYLSRVLDHLAKRRWEAKDF